MQIVLHRLVAELPCLAGVATAAALAYHGESAWVWAWFLAFGFVNVITGRTEK